MTLQRTALFAILGQLLVGVYYWVAQVIPSWGATASLPGARALLMIVAIAEPLVWTFYFGSIWLDRPRRAPALAACVVELVKLVLIGFPQYRTLSSLSLDTLSFLFGSAVTTLCWTILLLSQARNEKLPRAALFYLVLLAVLQTAFIAYQFFSTAEQVRAFGLEEPWQLILTPLIWLTYWGTQALFLRTLLRAETQRA